LCNGVRHLAWDAGYGFELRSAISQGAAYAVLRRDRAADAMTWLYVFLVYGDFDDKGYLSIG